MHKIREHLFPTLILLLMGMIIGSIGVGWAHADQNDVGGFPVNVPEGELWIGGPGLFAETPFVLGLYSKLRMYDNDDDYILFLMPELAAPIALTWPPSLPAGSNYPLVGNASGDLSFGASALPSSFISGSGTDNHVVRWDGTGNIQDSKWIIADNGDATLGDNSDDVEILFDTVGSNVTLSVISGTSVGWALPATWPFLIAADYVEIGNGTAGPGDLQLLEDEDNGTDTTGFFAPAALAGDLLYELPDDTPADGEQLTWTTGGDLEWQAAGGTSSGDVVGPAGAVDETIAVFDGATGKLIKEGTNWKIDTATEVMSSTTGNFSNQLFASIIQLDNSGNGTQTQVEADGIHVITSATTLPVIGSKVAGDANDRMELTDKRLGFGTGAAGISATMTRKANGTIGIGGSSLSQGALEFEEDTDNGTNTWTILPPTSLASDFVGVLPTDTPAANESLMWTAGDIWVWGRAIVNLATEVTGILALANGGTGSNLADPGADRGMFWDDSLGAVDWLRFGNGLTVTTNQVDVTAPQDPLQPVGLYAINATDVTAGTSNTSYCVYIGKAERAYSSVNFTSVTQVTTAAVTITWAEVAIATGAFNPGGNMTLTTVGSTSVSGTYNSLGTKSTAIAVTGIIPGDDLWFLWGSQATTPFILRALQDDISSMGLTGSRAATRPSTMGAGSVFTLSATNNPARVVVATP